MGIWNLKNQFSSFKIRFQNRNWGLELWNLELRILNYSNGRAPRKHPFLEAFNTPPPGPSRGPPGAETIDLPEGVFVNDFVALAFSTLQTLKTVQ